MSHALRAVILLRCQAAGGDWVAVKDLVAHLQCADAAVLGQCELMHGDGLLHVQRAEGTARIERVRSVIRPKARNLAEMAEAGGFGPSIVPAPAAAGARP